MQTKKLIMSVLLALPVVGVIAYAAGTTGTKTSTTEATAAESVASAVELETAEVAVFAGGCFWCVESDFDSVPGVLETISGYSGGNTDNPTYKDHHGGRHREVVKITYDSSKVSYDALLEVYWRSVDPTDAGGQFCDRGHSYTTAIYTLDDAQQEAAQSSKVAIEQNSLLSKPIVTEIIPAAAFWPAEDYHQDYYLKNPGRYGFYRKACGREKRVKSVWGQEAYAGIDKH